MQQLPIGIQSFSRLRQGDFLYIDKTPMVDLMVNGAGRYFLSRPRRFGKSLLVDTLRCLFEGHQALFAGLYIEPRWDWSQRFPVIKLDFAQGTIHSMEDFNSWVQNQLQSNAERLALDVKPHTNPGIYLVNLIKAARQENPAGVVVLVDEYDKPILDNIEQLQTAAQIREGLKNLYSVLKSEDEHLRFVLMTGVTKFSKVSLFSGLNQLNDITLDARYSTLCGYTQSDLEQHFAEHLQGVNWQELKTWYNGYQFSGQAVYNPFDILLFIDKGQVYRNYWFETGSPSFLVKLFQQQHYFLPNLDKLEVGEEILSSFDIEQINPITLLFQAGYLTLAGQPRYIAGQNFYPLKIPNQEVRQALFNLLADFYTQCPADQRVQMQQDLDAALHHGQLDKLEQKIKALFAGIPWRNFTHNKLADSEGYYASVLYAYFSSLNAEIVPEDISNRGQADLAIKLGDYIYVMEIKRDTSLEYTTQTPNPALAQIQERGYSQKYLASGKTVIELGLVFNTHARNLVQMDGGIRSSD